MAQYNPDEFFEKVVVKLSPIWAPFYAFYYLLRHVWREIFKKKH